MPLDPPSLDHGDGMGTALDRLLGPGGQVGRVDVELVQLAAVQMRQPGHERRAGRRGQVRLDRPIFARLEYLDLRLAVADQAQCHRLHTPGATAARQLTPQHGGQREAYQIIQRAAGEVGFDKRLIQFARMGNRVLDGGFRDFVERDAMHGDAPQRVLVLEHRADVPADGLAFAIGVGRQI